MHNLPFAIPLDNIDSTCILGNLPILRFWMCFVMQVNCGGTARHVCIVKALDHVLANEQN